MPLRDSYFNKAKNEIDDAPNDIELAIADIETVVAKAEEREEILNEVKLIE